jgi:hypothetical protein
MYLTIHGIAKCEGGGEDVERFLRLLPWLAQQELDFEPGSGPGEDYARVTSDEVRQFLGLPDDSGISLARLHEILQLERWGWGGGGSASGDEWVVVITRDVCRFSSVKTPGDYDAAQAQRDSEQAKRDAKRQDTLIRSAITSVVPLADPFGSSYTSHPPPAFLRFLRPVREVVPGGQGKRVLGAQHPLLDGQQGGVLVAGPGRIPRLSGPGGEFMAGDQGAGVLGA